MPFNDSVTTAIQVWNLRSTRDDLDIKSGSRRLDPMLEATTNQVVRLIEAVLVRNGFSGIDRIRGEHRGFETGMNFVASDLQIDRPLWRIIHH